MSEVRLVLSSEEYVELYAELAHRKMAAFIQAGYSQDGKTPVLVEAENGDTRYSDWAQDEFDDECGIIEELLSDVGIVTGGTMNKVRLVLSSEDYVGLVGELAERKLLALDTVSVDGVVYHTDNSGGTHFSDWAQDQFDNEVNEIKNILAEAGIFKEVT